MHVASLRGNCAATDTTCSSSAAADWPACTVSRPPLKCTQAGCLLPVVCQSALSASSCFPRHRSRCYALAYLSGLHASNAAFPRSHRHLFVVALQTDRLRQRRIWKDRKMCSCHRRLDQNFRRSGEQKCWPKSLWSMPAVSQCDVQFAPLPLPAYPGCGGRTQGSGGADSTSHILGKQELKGPSRQYVFVCLCECVNTIEMKLQPSVGR